MALSAAPQQVYAAFSSGVKDQLVAASWIELDPQLHLLHAATTLAAPRRCPGTPRP